MWPSERIQNADFMARISVMACDVGQLLQELLSRLLPSECYGHAARIWDTPGCFAKCVDSVGHMVHHRMHCPAEHDDSDHFCCMNQSWSRFQPTTGDSCPDPSRLDALDSLKMFSTSFEGWKWLRMPILTYCSWWVWTPRYVISSKCQALAKLKESGTLRNVADSEEP